MAVSETEYGEPWPPESVTSEASDDEDDRRPESSSAESEPAETPEKYILDDLANYKVQSTRQGRMKLTLSSPALALLYVVPGDRVRVFDHPDGILVTHAQHQRSEYDE